MENLHHMCNVVEVYVLGDQHKTEESKFCSIVTLVFPIYAGIWKNRENVKVGYLYYGIKSLMKRGKEELIWI